MTTARAERAAARATARALEKAPQVDVPAEAVCYLCLSRGDDGAPLLRNCACRGSTAGFAHMNCLIQYASTDVDEEGQDYSRWCECGMCKQSHFGRVRIGLARARWERVQHLPEEDHDRLAACDWLASTLTQTGDDAAAVPLYEEVLRVARRVYGDIDANVLVSMYNLASLHADMDNPHLALPLAEEAVRGCRLLHGDDHESTLTALDIMSDVHCKSKDYEKAESLAREVFAARKRVHGESNRDTLASMSQVAFICFESGDKAAALELYEEQLPLCRRTLGSEHPCTLNAIRNCGECRCQQGDFSGVDLLREAVAGHKKLGAANPQALNEAVEELEKGLKLKQKEEETIAERLAKRRRKQ